MRTRKNPAKFSNNLLLRKYLTGLFKEQEEHKEREKQEDWTRLVNLKLKATKHLDVKFKARETKALHKIYKEEVNNTMIMITKLLYRIKYTMISIIIN